MGWKAPEQVLRGDGGIAAVLVEHVRRVGQAATREQRGRALNDLAEAVRAGGVTLPVVARLAAADVNAQRLALEIVLRLPLPLEAGVAAAVVPMLGLRKVPVKVRTNVAVQLLRSLPPGDPLPKQALQLLVKGLRPAIALERLRHLRKRLVGCEALEQLSAELEGQMALDCPRCGVHLPRPEMVKHLWQEHRLVLDGERVREPWEQIGDWLAEYAKTARPELLERSCELGRQLDPEEGLVRVHRLLLSNGVSDPEALANLRAAATARKATLCPHCYGLVPDRPEVPVPPLNTSRGRLASRGYTVEVSESALRARLTVTTPKEKFFAGPEPGRSWTLRGAVMLFVGPLVLLAFVLALVLPSGSLPPLATASLLLLAALTYLRLRVVWDRAADPTERAIDFAWSFLVPRLHASGFSEPDAEFLAALARSSLRTGAPALRERSLERAGRLTQAGVVARAVPPEYLAALRRLEIDDAVRSDRDGVLILANQVGACLTGDLPLAFAEQLLAACAPENWGRGDRARLRVLLLAKAFEAGLEVWDLHELGRVVPVLGQAYASEDLDGLARLRWLWELKPGRKWQRVAPATTVFDLARYPVLGGQYLQNRPDLLLFQPMSDGESSTASGTPILICEEGVVYRDAVLSDPRLDVEVKLRGLWQGGGYELVAGPLKLTFRQEPTLLARRLRGWVRYLFRDFLPKVDTVLHLHAPERLGKLLKQKEVVCPECWRAFLAQRGEVGLPRPDQPSPA